MRTIKTAIGPTVAATTMDARVIHHVVTKRNLAARRERSLAMKQRNRRRTTAC